MNIQISGMHTSIGTQVIICWFMMSFQFHIIIHITSNVKMKMPKIFLYYSLKSTPLSTIARSSINYE